MECLIGKVVASSPLKKSSEKDQANGLKFYAVIECKSRVQIQQEFFEETHLYLVKTQANLDLAIGTRVVVEGKAWFIQDSGLRGVSNPKITKLPAEIK